MSDSVILWTVGQAPLYMEFSSQEYCSGLPFSLPVDLPDLGIEPMSLMFPPLAGDFFDTSTIWEAPSVEVNPQIQCCVVLAHPPLIIGSDSKAFPHQDDFCCKYHRPVMPLSTLLSSKSRLCSPNPEEIKNPISENFCPFAFYHLVMLPAS